MIYEYINILHYAKILVFNVLNCVLMYIYAQYLNSISYINSNDKNE